MGLFGLRDKDRSAFRVFIELLKAARAGTALSSDELSFRLGLTRGTVMHHINNLMKAGIVVSEANRYALRDSHLEFVIDELRKDLEREMDELKRAAREIDSMM